MLEAQVQRRSPAAYVARTHGPSAPAALKSGFIAGTVALILLQLFAIAIYDESPWQLARMTAALVRGPAALEPNDEYDASLVALGVLLHFSLALLYALALACVVAEAAPQHALLIGLAFGAALYFANFYGFAALFPWFAPHRTIDTFLVHMVFGAIIAMGYWVFDRPAR